MPTRRELLFNIVSTPFAAVLVEHPLGPASLEPEIIREPHCLSEESAKGFQLLLTRNRAGFDAKVIIVPGARQLSRKTGLQLLRKVTNGTWLILESGLPFLPRGEAIGQIRVVRDVFGLRVQAPIANGGAYIEYAWPLPRLVRDFSMFTPVECSADEKIAEFSGMAACAKRRIGNGGVIFLGSMLGPGLLAEEREAHELGSAMLQAIRKRR
jgi:hypothetical protein